MSEDDSMANPPDELGRAGNTDIPESVADHSADDHPAGRFPGPIGRAEEHLFHFRRIAADQEEILDLGQQEVDGIVTAFNERTLPELAGVDTSGIEQVDPGFDDEAFRAIARETFYKVRQARKLQNPQESAELLSPQMQRELQNAISGDVASHRHHLLPLLYSSDAVIAGAEVVGGQEQIDVLSRSPPRRKTWTTTPARYWPATTREHSWEERWRFMRDPHADTLASDERHEIALPALTSGWSLTVAG